MIVFIIMNSQCLIIVIALFSLLLRPNIQHRKLSHGVVSHNHILCSYTPTFKILQTSYIVGRWSRGIVSWFIQAYTVSVYYICTYPINSLLYCCILYTTFQHLIYVHHRLPAYPKKSYVDNTLVVDGTLLC